MPIHDAKQPSVAARSGKRVSPKPRSMLARAAPPAPRHTCRVLCVRQVMPRSHDEGQSSRGARAPGAKSIREPCYVSLWLGRSESYHWSMSKLGGWVELAGEYGSGLPLFVCEFSPIRAGTLRGLHLLAARCSLNVWGTTSNALCRGRPAGVACDACCGHPASLIYNMLAQGRSGLPVAMNVQQSMWHCWAQGGQSWRWPTAAGWGGKVMQACAPGQGHYRLYRQQQQHC